VRSIIKVLMANRTEALQRRAIWLLFMVHTLLPNLDRTL
jgi:beta-lactamase regulating signal transducer with metallopeptidase domain